MAIVERRESLESPPPAREIKSSSARSKYGLRALSITLHSTATPCDRITTVYAEVTGGVMFT
jgi:hypothetical protein